MSVTPRRRRHRWRVLVATVGLALATGVIPAASAGAAEPTTAVLDWNAHAVAALTNPGTATPPGAGQSPTVSAVHLAMVQIAVYDALNAIAGGYQPYLDGLPSAARSASQGAAAATAAHHVLVGIVPALPQAVRDSLDASYAASLAGIPGSQAKTDGIAIGAAAAAAMLADRANDGRYSSFSFTAGTDPGDWRPVLPAFASDPFAWVAKVRPFTLKSASQFRTAGPYPLTSAEYAAEFAEVKAYGAATGSSRSQAQTDLARFFSAAPGGFLNRALRELAARRGLAPAAQARLLAQTSVAGADSLIGCWDDKVHWSFWRPITAIREAANDGNPATTAQADWLPLFANPPYPDHPSGYNCYSAGMMISAARFFGTNRMTFSLTSPATGTTRTYRQFNAVLRDTVNARLYMGIHFRNPDEQGVWLGRHVALWVDRNFFGRAD